MKQNHRRLAALLGLISLLALLGAVLLHTATGTVRSHALREETFSGRLYQNSRMGESTVSAVVLAELSPGESRVLASELCRRGYVVLRLSHSDETPEAIQWLQAQPFIRADRLAVVWGNAPVPEALETCADQLAAGVFLSDGTEFSPGLAESSLPNALVFSAGAPTAQELGAFLRCAPQQAQTGKIFGYFIEHNARCMELTGSTPTYRDKRVQTRLFDWLGSAIGHLIELPDTQQRWAVADGFAAAGIVIGAAALALFLIPRVNARKFRNQEDPQP